jgi:radical SAM superfamily enzyme YgiQ (UPF0313 family)
MKVLLISTNRQRYLAPIPIGLSYISSSLKNDGHVVALMDLMFVKNPHNEIDEKIQTFKPDIIGFSIRNLDNQYMLNSETQLFEIKEYVKIALKYNIPAILGGPAFTTFPAQMLDFMNADYGICGEGEKSLSVFLKQFQYNLIPESIPGLVYRDNKGIKVNSFNHEGYSFKIPDWSVLEYKNYKKWLWPNNIVVKTGCSFNCSYCDSHLTQGSKINKRNIDDIIKDIKTSVKITGTRVFFLSDPCISFPPDFAKELFKEIIKQNEKIQFCSTIEPVRNCCDDEFISSYKKAGGIFAILGTETLSSKMLKSYNKPFDKQDILDWSNLARRKKLKFGLELLFGGPEENMDTINETLECLSSISFSLLMYSIGVRILPDTELEKIAIKDGIIKNREELFLPKYYVSDKIDISRSKEIIEKYKRKYSMRILQLLPVLLKNKIAKSLGIIVN